jgi:hypothetical protein
MHVILTVAFALFGLQQAPDVSQASAESAAFARIGAEKNLEAKKKLAVGFEKNFPKSNRLPELCIEMSRTLVSAIDYPAARQYAEKGVSLVAKMKSDAAGSGDRDPAHQQWLDSMDANTKKNLAWVNQMITWQQQQVRSGVLRKR